jgi:hypothetical protein
LKGKKRPVSLERPSWIPAKQRRNITTAAVGRNDGFWWSGCGEELFFLKKVPPHEKEVLQLAFY